MEDIFTVYYVFEMSQAIILVAHNTQVFYYYSRMVSYKYKNGDAVIKKAHHVTSNAECARRYSSHNNSKMVCGEEISYLNKTTDTRSRIWYVRAQCDLGSGTMKIAELNVRCIKASPVFPQFVSVPVPTPPNIPDIPLVAKAADIISQRRSIVHPYIVAVALPVEDPEITQPIPA